MAMAIAFECGFWTSLGIYQLVSELPVSRKGLPKRNFDQQGTLWCVTK